MFPGIVENQTMLDLCYEEDSAAQVDLNCVMNELGELIELQGTGEGRAFTLEEQQALVRQQQHLADRFVFGKQLAHKNPPMEEKPVHILSLAFVVPQ